MLTIEIRKYRNSPEGIVLDSATTHKTPDDAVAVLPHNDDAVINAINRGDTGHHFLYDVNHTYCILVKRALVVPTPILF